MNSNIHAVFAASLQWADAVKVVSRGTPRSRTSVTWRIRWSVSAAEKDGEKGGRCLDDFWYETDFFHLKLISSARAESSSLL